MNGKLDCPCGCGMKLGESIKFIAQSIEREIKQNLIINSGARCSVYNSTIKGAIAGDAHTKGKAIDVQVNFGEPNGRELGSRLILAATRAGIKRFGVAKTFVHIDCAEDLPTPRMWLYF